MSIYDSHSLFKKNKREKNKKDYYAPESYYLEIATQHFGKLSSSHL